jgi:hypothetical protein
MNRKGIATIATIACLAGFGIAQAASIPAWLDDAITKWNDANKPTQISFVDIKDEYVWYTVPNDKANHQDIRKSIYDIVQENGYKPTDNEERITTARPPASKQKKCWTRSFVLDIQELSNTTAAGDESGSDTGLRQRMLTSLVCQDSSQWFAGFRILQ